MKIDSFIVFLYFVLETAGDSIFLKPTQPGQCYKVKKGIEFHFYINSTPCGDATIFNPRDGKLDLR